MATALTPDAESQLRDGLNHVCAIAGLSTDGARLIKYTINAVFRLVAAPAVVRLSRGEPALARAEKVVKVADAFAALDLPTIRLLPGIMQPVRIAGWVATFWTHLPQPGGSSHLPVDLAEPLKRLHVADLPDIPMPRWDTVGEARRRVSRVQQLPPRQLSFTRQWADTMVGLDLDALLARLRDWADQLDRHLHKHTWRLPSGVIHGDARLGNLLRHPHGHVVLCDFDSVCTGPREWDLAPVALGPVRFGQDLAHYRKFADAYGHDLNMSPDGWHLLRQTRELQLVTSVIDTLDGRPAVARQLAHRLRTIINNDDKARWQSYE